MGAPGGDLAMTDEDSPASAEVVAQAVAEARAALARSTRPRPTETEGPRGPARAATPRPSPPNRDEALANLYASLRRLRAAVSDVEASLAEASLYLPDERNDR